MKAAYIQETGGPSVIQFGEVPTPEPRDSEVLVKIGAVGLNPIDTYIRAGITPFKLEFPFVIGIDFAGTVERVGSAVTRFKVGDRVWGSNQGMFGRRGSFGEYAAVDERWAYHTPETQTDIDAAGGGLAALTAHLGLFLHGNLKWGEVVFVNGGAGGVGSAVVQLAKAAGAIVITTAGSDEALELCRGWGAGLAVNYRDADLDAQIRAFSEPLGGINLWFETQREPTLDRTVGMMAKRGRIMMLAGRQTRPDFALFPFVAKELRIIGFALYAGSPEEQRAAAEQFNLLWKLGKWKPLVGKTMPLSEAATAHQLLEDNSVGKVGTVRGRIVLTVSDRNPIRLTEVCHVASYPFHELQGIQPADRLSRRHDLTGA